MRTRRLVSFLSAAALLGPGAGSALAQGGGVTVDPGSPSGKEYAIPLEQARREASSSDETGTPATDRAAPLFGEGVGPDSGGDSSAGAGTSPDTGAASKLGSGTGKAQKTTNSGAQRDGAVDRALRGPTVRAGLVTDGGSGGLVTVVALAVSVLLLGGVLGSIARRRTS